MMSGPAICGGVPTPGWGCGCGVAGGVCKVYLGASKRCLVRPWGPASLCRATDCCIIFGLVDVLVCAGWWTRRSRVGRGGDGAPPSMPANAPSCPGDAGSGVGTLISLANLAAAWTARAANSGRSLGVLGRPLPAVRGGLCNCGDGDGTNVVASTRNLGGVCGWGAADGSS